MNNLYLTKDKSVAIWWDRVESVVAENGKVPILHAGGVKLIGDDAIEAHAHFLAYIWNLEKKAEDRKVMLTPAPEGKWAVEKAAYAAGKRIQFSSSFGPWKDLRKPEEPMWNSLLKFRIHPDDDDRWQLNKDGEDVKAYFENLYGEYDGVAWVTQMAKKHHGHPKNLAADKLSAEPKYWEVVS